MMPREPLPTAIADHRRRLTMLIAVICINLAAVAQPIAAGERQISIHRIDAMPNLPQPFKIRDWRQTASDYDAFVFELNGHSGRPPLVWIDKAHRNFKEDAFGLYTSAWEHRGGPNSHGGEFHEAINTIPAVLGASLVGIDKSNQHGRNWVSMCRGYFNRGRGWDICANSTMPQPGPDGREAACEFWYHLYPNILFFQLASQYPNTPGFDELLHKASDQMYRATKVLKNVPRGFHYSWLNFSSMEPIYNGRFEQPDASAGFACLQYAAYRKFHDPKYLEGADWATQALVAEPKNPYYECLLPFGAYTAARLNAEEGRTYNLAKLVNWCFAGKTPCRGGDWGAVVGRWGEYDVSGLIGASDRVFLMNTFDTASPLVPLVRYDPRFARAIGKWMLNAANAARLFYPDELPTEYQAAADLKDAVKSVIAYEAISPNRNGQPIFADRDDWGPETRGPAGLERISQFSLYGSSHAGIFGAIIHRTSDERILMLDCLATDFYRDKAYPTYLIFNPYAEEKEVRIDVGPKRVDLYDAVLQTVIATNVCGTTTLKLAKDSAVVIVLTPVGGKVTHVETKRLIDGVVVDYRVGLKSAAGEQRRPTPGIDQYDLALRVNQKRLPRSETLPVKPATEAAIRVHAGRVVAELNPLFIGYNIEDLSYALHPGLCAQMLYGESFEDEPDVELPAGWEAWLEPKTAEASRDTATLRKWRGAWAFEDGEVTLVGARERRICTSAVQMTSGTVECELFQPSTERNFWGPGLLVCWKPEAYYYVHISPERHVIELAKGDSPNFTQSARSLASREVALKYDQWYRVKVGVEDGRIAVLLDGKQVLDFHDPVPLSGGVGLESSFCVARFRNLAVTPKGGRTWRADFSLKDRPYTHQANISRWWEPFVTGNASAQYKWDKENPYNTDRCQKIELLSGEGTVGIFNTGLHNWGLTFRRGWSYQGRVYLRGNYAGEVTLALQSRDGSKTYSTQKLSGLEKDWRRFDIRLRCTDDEKDGRFAIWIEKPGRIWVDQAILMPDESGLYKGLPVRRDLAEKLVAGISNIRFGGDMVNCWAFDWKQMLAPPDKRRQYADGWNYHKSPQFMIFEFLDFCRAAGVEPIVNFGEQTSVDEIADFLEYCNADNSTTWGRKRIESGKAGPYAIKYVMYGNGFPPLENVRRLAEAIERKHLGVKVITGDIGHETWTNFAAHNPPMAMAIGQLGKLPAIEALGSRPEVGELGSHLNWANNIEFTQAKYALFVGRGRPFFYAEEVNSGHHNWQRGLSDALHVMTCERYGKTVWGSSFCTALQASGNLYEWDEGHIQFTSGESWYQPSGWAVRLVGENFQPIVLETEVAGPSLKLAHRSEKVAIETETPALVASATRDRDAQVLVLKVVNLWGGQVTTRLDLGPARGEIIGGDYSRIASPAWRQYGTVAGHNCAAPGEYQESVGRDENDL